LPGDQVVELHYFSELCALSLLALHLLLQGAKRIRIQYRRIEMPARPNLMTATFIVAALMGMSAHARAASPEPDVRPTFTLTVHGVCDAHKFGDANIRITRVLPDGRQDVIRPASASHFGAGIVQLRFSDNLPKGTELKLSQRSSDGLHSREASTWVGVSQVKGTNGRIMEMNLFTLPKQHGSRGEYERWQRTVAQENSSRERFAAARLTRNASFHATEKRDLARRYRVTPGGALVTEVTDIKAGRHYDGERRSLAKFSSQVRKGQVKPKAAIKKVRQYRRSEKVRQPVKRQGVQRSLVNYGRPPYKPGR